MDDYRIIYANHSVEFSNLGLGADNPISLKTDSNHAYRSTKMDQIEDIINSGYVRPKGYGSRRERVGDKVYWTIGGKVCYYSKQPIIEADLNKLSNGQIGGLFIDNLTGVWLFDENQNKYVNKIDEIKNKYKEVFNSKMGINITLPNGAIIKYKQYLEEIVYPQYKDKVISIGNGNTLSIKDYFDKVINPNIVGDKISYQNEMISVEKFVKEVLPTKVTDVENKESSSDMYDRMINAVKKANSDNLSDDERKKIVGEIYYYESYLVNSLNDEKEIMNIINKAVNDLSDTKFSNVIFNSLISDLQEKIKPKENIKETAHSNLENLKNEYEGFVNQYKVMLEDGIIDDEELSRIMININNIKETVSFIKENSVSETEKKIADELIESIEEKIGKMNTLDEGIKKTSFNL